jgi:glycosyltransferase involved in cell wall biosynthesis
LPFNRCKEKKKALRDKYGFGLSDIIIIFIGSLKKIKGSDILLKAFIQLGEQYIRRHNLKLLFVGDGEMRRDLEFEIKEEKLSEHVKFLGRVLYKDIPELYKIADLYIIPSLFEGMSNALLEAMFNEVPIIGNDVSGISNMIDHEKNGLLFKQNSYYDLKDKIKCLIENKDLADKIAREARRTYDANYWYESVVNQYEEIYETVGRVQKSE